MDRRIRLAFLGPFAFLATAISSTIVGPSLPFMKEDLVIDLFWLGILGGAWNLGYLFTFLGGVVSDRYGDVATITMSFLVVFSGLALASVSKSYGTLVVFIVLTGLGAGFVESTASSLTFRTHSNKPALAMNMVHSFWCMGAAIGPGVAWFVLETFGDWRYAYSTSAFMYLPLIAYSILCLRGVKGRTEPVSIAKNTPRGRGLTLNLLLVGLAGFFTQAVEVGVNVWLPSFLMTVHHFSLRDASLTLSLFFVFMAVGRIGLSRILNIRDYGRTMTILVILLSVSILLAAATDVEFASAGLWALSGLFLGPLFPTLIARVNSLNPRRPGFSTGALFTMALPGGILSSWIVGYVAELTSLDTAIFALAVFAPFVLTCNLARTNEGS